MIATAGLIGTISSRGTLAPSIYDYYVSTTGSDSNNGSQGAPFLTPEYAVGIANATGQPKTISIAAGTYTLMSYLFPALGVSIIGAGIDVTILRPHSSLYFSYTGSAWHLDKFLIQCVSVSMSNGNHTFKDFTIDGVSKQGRGGIYINNQRNNILDNLKVIDNQGTGIWINGTENSLMRSCYSSNNGWSSFGFALAGTHLARINGLEIDTCFFNEDFTAYGKPCGYGIKCIDFANQNNIEGLYMHDSIITVDDNSIWNGGSAANISFEVFQQDRKLDIHFLRNYFDNHVSMVGNGLLTYTGTPSVHIEYCTFDLVTRAAGHGYSYECQIGDVEVDHCLFWGGTTCIVQWGGHHANHWKVHHNTAYYQTSFYPTAIFNMFAASGAGLNNGQFFNNFVEVNNPSTATFNGNVCELNFFEFNNTADMANTDIANNVFFVNHGGTNCKFINLKSASNTVSNTTVRYNLARNANGGIAGQAISGITYGGTNTENAVPGILATGVRPIIVDFANTYYKPTPTGNLDQSGINVGLPFEGTAPSRGSYENVTGGGGGGTAPANTVLPVISVNGGGIVQVGATLSVTTGTWTGTPPITYSYQWKRGVTNIGTNSASYTLVAADAFNTITCVVTANNVAGSANATSAATASVRYFLLNTNFPDLTGFTEVDPINNRITITPNSPGFTITNTSGQSAGAETRVQWDTLLSTAILGFEIRMLCQVTVDAQGFGFKVGISNTVNPNPNRLVMNNVNHEPTPASRGKARIQIGDGATTNYNFTQVAEAATAVLPADATDYEMVLRRDYNGSGDSTFTAKFIRVSDLAESSVQYVATGAPEQAFMNTTSLFITSIAGTKMVKNLSFERLN